MSTDQRDEGRAAEQRALNVVVVLTDDQGAWSMPHLMPELHMPELETLRQESMEFTKAYCPSPVCSPARASLVTGRTPSAHGVHDWLVGTRHPDARPDRYLEGQPTTPEVLARAGYRCGLSGKWHVGDTQVPAPGFSYWYAHRFGGGPYFDAPIWRDGVAASEPKYLTDAITDHAVEFLEQQTSTQPFWLGVHYTAPHTPWHDAHPDDLTALYRDCTFPSVPQDERHPWSTTGEFDFAFEDPISSLVGYSAALSGVDRGLGRIRAALCERGLHDNTVIVYLSDNGFSCGQRGLWGKGNGTTPLNFFANSVQVPLLVHLPQGATGRWDEPVSTRWLHRTTCQLTAVVPDHDQWGDEGSFAEVLTDPEAVRASSAGPVVVTAEYGQGRMITDGRFVHVHRSNLPDELYDHDRDPDERHNFIDDPALSGVLSDLRGQLVDWFSQHERAGSSGFELPVEGVGQIHPQWRGRDPRDSFVARGTAPHDR